VYLVFLIPDVAGTASLLGHSNDNSDTSDSNNNSFEDEEPHKLMRWGKQNWKLNGPENEMGHHLLRGNTNRLGNMVRNVEVRRPDSTDALSHGCRASICLNGMPEKSCDHSNNNGEASKVPAESRFKRHREGDMKALSNSTVENKRYCAYQATEDDTNDRLPPSNSQ